MDSREALRKLRARKEVRDTTLERSRNPLFQILKAILAFLGPVLCVYYGNYYISRNTADVFCRDVFATIDAGKLTEVYKQRSDVALQANETLEQFANRFRNYETNLGKLQSATMSAFEIQLVGGAAFVQYDAILSKGVCKYNMVLLRQGLSGWRLATLVLNVKR
ncbi:MAG: hypothetical protein HY303_11655 [Candidatus Wallbacteria bacterium]|nr:hypothetical protein [Candidatus Wallbacteria bacterium]